MSPEAFVNHRVAEMSPILPNPAALQADRVIRFALVVADLERELDLFVGTLGFRLLRRDEFQGEKLDALYGVPDLQMRRALLAIGGQEVALVQYARPPGAPYPQPSRSNDIWFQHLAIVVRDMEAAYEIVRKADIIPVSTRGPQTIPEWNTGAAGVKAFYFRDREHHPLELIYFPPDKGHPVWHTPGDNLFLGIDHSAIVVSSTEKSLAFYRDLLGLKIIGEGLNHGETQEWLSSVPGARVKITALRHDGDFNPGIEFLEYIEPQGGNPIPATRGNNDHAYGHSVISCTDLEAMVAKLKGVGVKIISDHVVHTDHDAPFRSGCMVRDPDGHDVLLVSH